MKDKTCFKSIVNPSTIDLFITNHPLSFCYTFAISTGLSDFHKMGITVLKKLFKKLAPKEIIYRDYKNFNEDPFNFELRKVTNNDNLSYHSFEKDF